MWYQVAMVLSAWALVEHWEAVNSSPDSTEKVLQVVSSHLLDKVAQTAAGTMRLLILWCSHHPQ